MNILFLYDAPLRAEVGGTERATSLVLMELSRRGHNCLGLLHFDQQHPEVQYVNGNKIDSIYLYLTNNKIEVVVNQIAFHPRFLNQFLGLGGQQWMNEGGKIISFMHLDPSPPPHLSLSSYFSDWKLKSVVGKLRRVIYVFTLPYVYYKADKRYRQGLRYLYETSNRYVLMSKSFIPAFKKLARIERTDKLRIIPNMLTFPDIITTSDLKDKKKIVLIVARLDDEQKNISFMIDAWCRVKNHRGYKLHILGEGKDREKLRKRAQENNSIVFEGAQAPLWWYRKAQISLMASPREGWGLTITESLQNGVVPIVLNTSTVFEDIIADGVNGWLPQNKEQFVDILSQMIKEDNVREQIAKNGLQSVCKFSSKNVGDLWEKMLNEL